MATSMEIVGLDVSRAWSAEGRSGPVSVEVLEGTVHLTLEGDATDHVLEVGEAFEGPPRRLLAVAGLSPSRIRVTTSPELPVLTRLGGPNARPIVRHLLGGALILAVWVSLWTWVAVGVVGPLSARPQVRASDVASTAS